MRERFKVAHEDIGSTLGVKFQDCLTNFAGTAIEIRIKLYESDDVLLLAADPNRDGYEQERWIPAERLRVLE